MTIDQDEPLENLARFRAMVLADPDLQRTLDAFDDVDSFVPEVMALAHARGLGLDVGLLTKSLALDPIGMSRWSDDPPMDFCPQPGWLPVSISRGGGQDCLAWIYFGKRALKEPFFEDSIRRALWRPFNRLMHCRTRLADLEARQKDNVGLQPDGFIFHMSRCGSTLVSQMLAADPRNIVISEASPLDAIVTSARVSPPESAEAHVALLRAMVSALGCKRNDKQSRYFIKLDSWHTFALPLFRRAFPSVPWIFLYREPSEVLASQLVQRGTQTVPEFLPPALYGLKEEDVVSATDYCAQVLARTCEAVLEPCSQGGGLLVNYNQLPEALYASILPHFGIPLDEGDRERMDSVLSFDAKNPGQKFSAVNEFKRTLMTDEVLAIAERHIGNVYRALENQRLAGRHAGPRDV